MYSKLQQKAGQILEGKAYPGFWDAVLLLVLILVTVLLFGAIASDIFRQSMERGSMGSRSMAPSGEFTIWITAIANTLAFSAAILISRASAKRPWNELIPVTRKTPYFPAYLVTLALLGLGLSVIFSEVENFVRFLMPPPDWMTEMMAEVVSNGRASFIALVIVAPLTEEMFFRGVVLSGFVRRYSPAVAILLSALLFSLIHINPYQMTSAFGIGLILAWIRILSGSLWPCIYLHALNNGAAFFVTSIGLDIPGYSIGDATVRFQPWWFNGMGLLLICSGLILSCKLFFRRSSGANVLIPSIDPLAGK